MMYTWSVCACVLVFLTVSSAERNMQSWSEQTYLGVDHKFTCNDYGNVSVRLDDILAWRKRDEIGKIETDDHHELTAMYGINNMELKLIDITEAMSGIYICDVMDSSGAHVSNVVKGLNLGGQKYKDNMDKYRHGIVVGLIAGAATLGFLLAVYLIDRFRYLTDEQKQKRGERKQERVQQQSRWNNANNENKGFEMTEDVAANDTGYVNGDSREANTHL